MTLPIRPTPAASDQRSTSARHFAPLVGEVSRPSVKAWMTRSSTPSLAASSISAFRWRSAECTPPSETSPMKCTRGAPRSASSSTSFSASDPSSTASSMRTRSCLTIAPAPRLRWPTSELPICPSGSPTLGPHAVSVVWSCSSQSRSNTGVSASATALPGPSGASPQPSRITRQTAGTVVTARHRRARARHRPCARTSRGRGWRRRRARRRCRGVRAAPRRCAHAPASRTLPMQASAGDPLAATRPQPTPPAHRQQRPAATSRSLPRRADPQS